MVDIFDRLLQVSDVFVLCFGKTVLKLHKLSKIVDLIFVALDQGAHLINLIAKRLILLSLFGYAL